MFKLSYEKCVCFIFLVILVFISCSGFHTDRLVTLTDHNKKYPFTSSSSSSSSLNDALSAQFDSEFVMSVAEVPNPWLRRRRHDARPRRNRQQRRPPRFCPGHDVATRAYHAAIVIEGLVRSKKIPQNASEFATSVSVEVKKIHRNDPTLRPLNISNIIRLHFANRQHKGCDDKLIHGLVPAKLNNGEYYIFFLKSVAMYNFTVLGQPVPLPREDKKLRQIERQIHNAIDTKKVRSAKIQSLKTSKPNMNIKLNDKVTLTCTVKGNPPPVITWYRNGTQIRRGKTEKTRIRHIHERKSNLTIQNFSPSDSGRYECRAIGVVGNAVSKSTNLVLHKEYPEFDNTNCSPQQDQEYCLNGGTCVRFGSLEEIACNCSTGFRGQRCEHKDITSQTSTYPRSWTCTLGLSNSYYC